MTKIEEARIDYEYLNNKDTFYNYFCDFIVNKYDEIKDCISICTDFKKNRLDECDASEKTLISGELLWKIKKYFDSEIN